MIESILWLCPWTASLRKGVLQMSIPFKESRHYFQTAEMDMDEATGRVVIWG